MRAKAARIPRFIHHERSPDPIRILSNRGKRRRVLIRPPLKDFHFAIPQGWGVVLAEKVPFLWRESDAPNCISPLGTGNG